ncbi:MAG: metallophosphoesterase [Muribaculaceae bacterium]|nr:metallophosphoesterase [Muribaculaceae bacterium]
MRLPVIVIVLLFVLSIAIDWYIHSDIRYFSRKESRWPRIYAISSVACWIFLVVTVCLPRRSESDSIMAVMWMLYSYLTVYAAKLVYVICSLVGRLLSIGKPKRFASGLWAGVPLGALTFVCMWWGVLVTRHQIETNYVDVYSPKLPYAFEGYRVAQVSDMHVGTWGNDTTFISKLVDAVNAQQADLIVFTGDVVNRKTEELRPFLSVLSRLHAPDGVFSILGNHDYGDYVDWNNEDDHTANNQQLWEWEKDMGWTLLNNDYVLLKRNDEHIALIGVENWGEPPFHVYGDLDKAYPAPGDTAASLNDNRYKLLLSHNPEHWNQIVSHDTNIDLTLSGHTHAMQFMLRFGKWKWSPSQYRYEQWGGLYERLNKNGEPVSVYVNIGSGEVAMPFRIGATPEITVLTLHRGRPETEKSK